MDNIQNMTILEIGQKAVENFVPKPFDEVDRWLHEAAKLTWEELKEDLKKEIQWPEREYA